MIPILIKFRERTIGNNLPSKWLPNKANWNFYPYLINNYFVKIDDPDKSALALVKPFFKLQNFWYL